MLDREAAFLNVLGLPPNSPRRIVPATPPSRDRIDVDWQQLLALAEENRPSIIELKLLLEADYQRLLVAHNDTRAQLDAFSLYRMNGLGGRLPTGQIVSTTPGQFQDFQVGLSLALPLGQRAPRAFLRQTQLNLARDQALLQQRILETQHELASSLRNLQSLYAQYEANRKVREASEINLDRQFRLFRIGGLPGERITAVEVLVAVTDWGNSVSAEALSLTLYNSQVAALARDAGIILEEHGIVFYEEQYPSIGFRRYRYGPRCYPQQTPPSENADRYDVSDEPAEESFDLQSLVPDLETAPTTGLDRDGVLPAPPRIVPRQLVPLNTNPPGQQPGTPPGPTPPTQPEDQPDASQPESSPPEEPPPVEFPNPFEKLRDLLPGGKNRPPRSNGG